MPEQIQATLNQTKRITMTELKVKTGADIFEPTIRHKAPLYGMKASSLARYVKNEITGEMKSLRFPPSKETKVVDAERGVKWEPLPFDYDGDAWMHGQVTFERGYPDRLHFGSAIERGTEHWLPDMFIFGNLIVSEKARDVLTDFAPDTCYFSLAAITFSDTGDPIPKKFFNVFVRRSFSYDAPYVEPTTFPRGGNTLISTQKWNSLVKETSVQRAMFETPIFLINRAPYDTFFSASLFKKLKEEKITGLWEWMPDDDYPDELPMTDQFIWQNVLPVDPAA